MDLSKKFYNDTLINAILPILLEPDVLTLNSFEKFANSDIVLDNCNILKMFIYFNFFVGRFNSEKYNQNLKLINERFFNSEGVYSYNHILKNKKKLVKYHVMNPNKSNETFLEIIVNFEKFCSVHKEIGINIDKLFKEIVLDPKFNEIVYNDLMVEYSKRLLDFISFFITYEKILLDTGEINL